MSNPEFELITAICQAVVDNNLDQLTFEKDDCKVSVKYNPAHKFAETINEKLKTVGNLTDDELLLDPYKGL